MLKINNLLNARQYFSTDFHQCRQGFFNALSVMKHLSLEQHQWQLSAFENTGALTTDATFIGNTTASKAVVLISGTHGVEGYCGSAIQQFLIQTMTCRDFKLPEDLAVVFVHALNPWGMYWARRCDQQGIDLNRNFVDFKQMPVPNQDYPEVLACLTIADGVERSKQLSALEECWGQNRFDKAFSGGQYTCSWAPFYGGEQPAFASCVVEQLIERWSLDKRELVVIDLHTGLGPWAYGELISDHPLGRSAIPFSQNLFGEGVAITAQGKSFSVEKSGLLDYRWHQLMEKSGCFLTLEFGTFGTDALFSTLLDEHLFWHHNPQPTLTCGEYQKHRKAMQRHFCPDDLLWQQATLFKAWQVFNKIITAYS